MTSLVLANKLTAPDMSRDLYLSLWATRASQAMPLEALPEPARFGPASSVRIFADAHTKAFLVGRRYRVLIADRPVADEDADVTQKYLYAIELVAPSRAHVEATWTHATPLTFIESNALDVVEDVFAVETTTTTTTPPSKSGKKARSHYWRPTCSRARVSVRRCWLTCRPPCFTRISKRSRTRRRP